MTHQPHPDRPYLPHDHPPHLRASDAQREQVAERVRAAAGDGRLGMEEVDERLGAVYAAQTHADLQQTIGDLYDPRPPYRPPYSVPTGPPQPAPQPVPPAPMYVYPVPYEQQPSDKLVLPAFLLCAFLGLFGAHRFYAGKIGTGITMVVLTFVTFGIVTGVWWLIDLIILATGTFRDGNNRIMNRWTQ